MRRQHREEVRKLMEGKDAEVEALHQRVRGAIGKKDETIAALRDQCQAALIRADHLEQVRACVPTYCRFSRRY